MVVVQTLELCSSSGSVGVDLEDLKRDEIKQILLFRFWSKHVGETVGIVLEVMKHGSIEVVLAELGGCNIICN